MHSKLFICMFRKLFVTLPRIFPNIKIAHRKFVNRKYYERFISQRTPSIDLTDA